MFTLPSTQKSTLKSIVNLISLKLKLELTDPLYCEPSMQNHAYNAIKMRGFTMRTGRFTHCYICSFLCVLRARLEPTNYLMITQGGKKQRKSISLESWETASRITTDYLSNWHCVPTITALWPSLDQPSLLQHPSAPPTIVRSADPLSQIGRPTNIGVATSRPPCYAILTAQMHYSVHVFLYPTNVQKDFTFRHSYITPPKT